MSDIVRDAIAAGIAELKREVRDPEPPLGRGVDLVCIDDIDPRFTETDPNDVAGLAQDLYHRLCTERGTLPDDDDYGLDLRRYLSRPTDDASLLLSQTEIAAELEKDDRVASAEVELTMLDPKTLSVAITIEPNILGLGPFTMIVAVTNGETHMQLLGA